jgi:hypothetical protein
MPDSGVRPNEFESVVKLDTRLDQIRRLDNYCIYEKALAEKDLLIIDRKDWKKAFRGEIFSENSRIQNANAVRVQLGLEPLGKEKGGSTEPQKSPSNVIIHRKVRFMK